METTAMAAPRDASLSRDGRGGRKYHVIVSRDRSHGVGACGTNMLYLDCEEPAAGLMPSERCERPGCREAFARLAAQPDPTP